MNHLKNRFIPRYKRAFDKSFNAHFNLVGVVAYIRPLHPTKVAQIEPISLEQNEPKWIALIANSGTDQTEMPGTFTPKRVAQNQPKYPFGKLSLKLRQMSSYFSILEKLNFKYGN